MARFGQFRLILSRPWVFALVAMGVSADMWYWGTSSPRHVPLMGVCCAAAWSRTYHPIYPQAIVMEVADVFRLVGKDRQDFLEMRDTPPEGVTLRAHIISYPNSPTTGLFAPVVRRLDHTMYIGTTVPSSAAELAEFRTLYAQYLANGWSRSGSWNQRHAQLLAQGDGVTRDILWFGLVHDLLILPFFLAFVWSAYLNFFRPDIRRERRRLALLNADLCPKCRYDIASLRGTHTICPECGADITPSPPAPH